jgi:hypothetical protein
MDHTSGTTFLSALCVIRCPSYLVWSRTFLLGVGLTDLGDFGRYFGQNKEIVSVFNGSVVYFNVGIVGPTFLGRSCSTRQELYFQLFFEMIWPLDVVEILCPEANVRPPHNTCQNDLNPLTQHQGGKFWTKPNS